MTAVRVALRRHRPRRTGRVRSPRDGPRVQRLSPRQPRQTARRMSLNDVLTRATAARLVGGWTAGMTRLSGTRSATQAHAAVLLFPHLRRLLTRRAAAVIRGTSVQGSHVPQTMGSRAAMCSAATAAAVTRAARRSALGVLPLCGRNDLCPRCPVLAVALRLRRRSAVETMVAAAGVLCVRRVTVAAAAVTAAVVARVEVSLLMETAAPL